MVAIRIFLIVSAVCCLFVLGILVSRLLGRGGQTYDINGYVVHTQEETEIELSREILQDVLIGVWGSIDLPRSPWPSLVVPNMRINDYRELEALTYVILGIHPYLWSENEGIISLNPDNSYFRARSENTISNLLFTWETENILRISGLWNLMWFERVFQFL